MEFWYPNLPFFPPLMGENISETSLKPMAEKKSKMDVSWGIVVHNYLAYGRFQKKKLTLNILLDSTINWRNNAEHVNLEVVHATKTDFILAGLLLLRV